MPLGPGRALMRLALGQLRTFSTLPHCLWAVGSGQWESSCSLPHCSGQWAVGYPRFFATRQRHFCFTRCVCGGGGVCIRARVRSVCVRARVMRAVQSCAPCVRRLPVVVRKHYAHGEHQPQSPLCATHSGRQATPPIHSQCDRGRGPAGYSTNSQPMR